MFDQPGQPQNYIVRYPSGQVLRFYGTFRLTPGPKTNLLYPMIFQPDSEIVYALDPRGIVTLDVPTEPAPLVYSPHSIPRDRILPEFAAWLDQHPEWK